jgi:hypothetical protein
MPITIQGGLVDRSIAGLTTTSTSVMAENKGRQYLLLVNVHATVDIWVDLQGGTAAPNTAGSIRLAANGGFYEMVGPFVSTDPITARSASATADLTAFEA